MAKTQTKHHIISANIFVYGSTALVCLGLLTADVSRSQSDISRSVELLWKSERPVPETSSILQSKTNHNRQTSIIPAWFEPATPASERPQTHNLIPRGHWAGLVIFNCLQIVITVCDMCSHLYNTSIH
jgi:hypothetical protein